MGWIDAHCHLDPHSDVAATLAEAHAAGVDRMVTVGVDVASSEAAVGLAARHEPVSATAGVHPHEARHGTDGLVELVASGDVVAVGECGLDYHYDHSPRDTQRAVFAEQIALANRHGLPLVIHTREAWDDTLDVLVAEGVPARTVIHCFSGGPEDARRCLDIGCVLSFSGIITFPSAGDVREAAVLAPLDRLMVETDSPYLAPVPHRGKRNQPAWVTHVGATLAELRGEPLSVVAAATSATTAAFFGLDAPPA
ncbi:MAG: TatD family hydrolase [Acidimicrobiia bacterium]|nr:TatD family hydrolase [Acidimicrobiia bacterium]